MEYWWIIPSRKGVGGCIDSEVVEVAFLPTAVTLCSFALVFVCTPSTDEGKLALLFEAFLAREAVWL